MFRRLWLPAAVGVLVALTVLAAGHGLERAAIGASDDEALARVAAEVRADVDAMASDLHDMARRATVDPLRLATPSDPESARLLFDAASAALQAAPQGRSALTIYSPAGTPLAWSGRPSDVPLERLAGQRSLFIVPGPLGPRLVHVEPLHGAADVRARIGAIAAERILGVTDPTAAGQAEAITLATTLVPVSVRARYEGGGHAVPPNGFIVFDRDGEPLLEAHVSPGAFDAVREAYRSRAAALASAVLAVTMLLVSVPVLDRRERTRAVRPFLAATLAVALCVLVARLLLAFAVPAAWVWPRPPHVPQWVYLALFRSAADLLATGLTLLAWVLLAADGMERWRLWTGPHAPLVSGRRAVASFVVLHLLAGAALTAVLVAHQRLLEALVTHTRLDLLQFSLHPLEPERLAAVLGVVVLHAVALWGGIVMLRSAASRWRVRPADVLVRTATAALWLTPVALGLWVQGLRGQVRVVGPLVLAAIVAIVVSGLLRRVAPRYRHASQALRLVTAFVALAIPSLVFYPTVAALARQSTDRAIEQDLAPQALAHRDQLQVQLRASLAQIDLIPGLDELIASSRRVEGEPPPIDGAFHLWRQTELARRRLTSSIELYAADASLVSRFALNLPAEASATERWSESGCGWDLFGEPLAGTEDRVLLHAGRGVCEVGAGGAARPVGAIVVHVMLDYGTLPFLASQNPYGELLQADGEVRLDTHGRRIEFAMYGWGRTPVFPTEGSAWPISSALLARMYRAGRAPIWEVVQRGDRPYRVFFTNDRSGIYALGYAVRRPVEHVIALAELLTLAGLAYVLLLGSANVLAVAGGYRASTGRALLREVRRSFYRKLFLAFVAASVIPVLALALLTRAYVAGQLRDSIELAAGRTASVAKRVVESVASEQRRDTDMPGLFSDEVMVGVSRIISEDVNVFSGPRLSATSHRDLFALGLLPTRTPAEVYRAIVVERQASYVGEEQIGDLPYMVAAAPVREGEVRTILTVPLALRQQEIEREIDALDQRVLLAAVCFILLGAAIGYSMAERIADPVNRLTRATRRIAAGDLDARIVTSSADEFSRLVEAFNGMAADLQRQRGELERTNRLEAWADMARQVAHDIKNPLTPIQLSAEHLRRVHHDRGEPLAPVLDSCVDTILAQVRMLRQISAEFSSFASAPVARLAPTSINAVVEEVLQPYRTAQPGRVDIHADFGEPLPQLSLDRTLLGRALVNIVENALHAMPSGGTLRVRTAREGAVVAVTLTDTGVGMDEEARARLFEPYFSTRASGTGLGLTIAKRNVELNAGTIEVESAPGRGTTVRLLFAVDPEAS